MNTNTASKKAPKQTASICLYGNSKIGFYCLADSSDGQRFGKLPEQGGRFEESCSLAIWKMGAEIEAAGIKFGSPLAIHMDIAGVPRVAFTKIGQIPNFGGLKWEA